MPSATNASAAERTSGVDGQGTSGKLKNEIPRLEGDPFELLLKPMREKDTAQCAAWKDEVQNILIFAGLFSAVVTAFITESYQRLQPDPNNVMVDLLAHIADRLDNTSNQTESVSSIIANTSFVPSRTDIDINVLWFISLVLSLTVALIGIVALQWLREHQRYDTALEPKETMAILNARLHSFEQWYVPQIFAGLPLLLQGALVLFFAGIIEFLFALRLEVAIPVTLAICIPLVFLIATTILPLLQVCILQDPFRLSINNIIPSPCPYKSPQSLLVRHFGSGSHNIFTSFASIVASIYICIVKFACIIRRLTGKRPPIFHSQRPYLKQRLLDKLPQGICNIRHVSGDWNTTDRLWLRARTTYALLLQMVHRDDNDLIMARTADPYESLLPEVYDCTSYFHKILHQNSSWANADLFSALYTCIAVLCTRAMDNFETVADTRDRYGKHVTDQSLVTDLCFAFGRFVCDGLDGDNFSIPAAFIDDVIRHESSDDSGTVVKTLPTALMTSWAFAISKISPHVDPTAHPGHRKLTAQLFMNRLEIGPERLFLMSSDEAWLPKEVLSNIQHFSRDDPLGEVARKQFFSFLENCSRMQPNSRLVHRGPARQSYKSISAYMRTIFSSVMVPTGAVHETFVRLTKLCTEVDRERLIQEKPFLLIAACFFLDVAGDGVGNDGSESLLAVILESCGTSKGSFDWIKRDKAYGWTELDNAIAAIYNHHQSPHHSAIEPSGSTFPSNPNGFQNHV